MRRLVLLAAVTAVTLAGCGGDDDTTTIITQAPPTETATEATTASTGEVPLTALDGSSASGTVTVLPGGQPLVDINAEGLQPTGSGENYILWLYSTDDVAFPLARDTVGSDGVLVGAAPVPKQLLPLLSRFDKVRFSRATNAETQAALSAAVDTSNLPGFVGVPVLEGDNPRG